VYDLVELVTVPQVALTPEYEQRVRKKLEEKAATMKTEAEKAPD